MLTLFCFPFKKKKKKETKLTKKMFTLTLVTRKQTDPRKR
jgi:hypothetical protein